VWHCPFQAKIDWMKKLVLVVFGSLSLWIAPAKAQTINVSVDSSRHNASLGADVRVINDVAIFPNPARNEVNVAVDPALGIKTISVYNLIGKVVISSKVTSNNVKMDIEDIPVGIYFLRAIDAQGRVITTRKFTHQ
jgi:hypothetical protein